MLFEVPVTWELEVPGTSELGKLTLGCPFLVSVTEIRSGTRLLNC